MRNSIIHDPDAQALAAVQEEMDGALYQFAGMQLQLGLSAMLGGPETYMGVVRKYAREFRINTRRLSLEVDIPRKRLDTLFRELDGPTPGEVERLSAYFNKRLDERDMKLAQKASK